MRINLFLFVLLQAMLCTARADLDGKFTRQEVEIPFDHGGQVLAATLFTPSGYGSPPLVILNHGSSLGEKKFGDEYWWQENHLLSAFLARGYAVLMPLRRGFGETKNKPAESEYHCDSRSPDFHKLGLEAARDIMAALEYAETLPYIDRNRIVLAGYHSGGFAALATASLQPSGVVAVAGFSLGRSDDSSPPEFCFSDEMDDAIGRYAKYVLPPVLWLYSDDDRSIPYEAGRDWYDTFRDNGGMGEFSIVRADSFSDHEELFGKKEAERWLSVFEQFLRDQGLQGMTFPD